MTVVGRLLAEAAVADRMVDVRPMQLGLQVHCTALHCPAVPCQIYNTWAVWAQLPPA
jgi:hypothetical protein